MTYARLLGEFIGTLKGVCINDIPEDLRLKLQSKLKELEALEVEEVKPDSEIIKSTIDKIIEMYVPDGNPEIWINKIYKLRDEI